VGRICITLSKKLDLSLTQSLLDYLNRTLKLHSLSMDNTLTSRTQLRKEVPKLTMQEKIENQEILTRINRKIDFKKNPRYEGQRLPKFSEVDGKQVQ